MGCEEAQRGGKLICYWQEDQLQEDAPSIQEPTQPRTSGDPVRLRMYLSPGALGLKESLEPVT